MYRNQHILLKIFNKKVPMNKYAKQKKTKEYGVKNITVAHIKKR